MEEFADSPPVTGHDEVDAALAAVSGETPADQLPSLQTLSESLTGILDQRREEDANPQPPDDQPAPRRGFGVVGSEETNPQPRDDGTDRR